jgi:hypothetical protein
MSTDPYGPVELFVLRFPQQRLPGAFREAVTEALTGGAVTLLDLTVIRRLDGGEIEIVELDALGDELDLNVTDLGAQGLIADEDLQELAGDLDAAGTAVVLAIEHTWARRVVGSMFDAGATVVESERIPAAVVNEIAALAVLDADPA